MAIQDSLRHLAQPTPAWLAGLTPDDIRAGPGVWRDALVESALVYPGSGADGSPIRQCTGIVHSFVYLDLSVSFDDFKRMLTKRRRDGQGFKGHSLVGLTEFDVAEFLGARAYLAAPPADGPMFGLWAVYQNVQDGNAARFSLLILHVEAMIAIASLFHKPPFAVVAQSHGFASVGEFTLDDSIEAAALCYPPPVLLIVGERHPLQDLVRHGRLLGEDVAVESVHKNLRRIYELPRDLEPASYLIVVEDAAHQTFEQFASDFLTFPIEVPNELRLALKELAARGVSYTLVPAVIAAFDRMLLANDTNEEIRALWPQLTSALEPWLTPPLAVTRMEDDSPEFSLWRRNQVAARVALARSDLRCHMNNECFQRLRHIARRVPDDARCEIDAHTGGAMSDTLLQSWEAADTPEFRWGVHCGKPIGSTDPKPSLSDAERRSLMQFVAPALHDQRHCPECANAQGAQWLLVAQALLVDGYTRATHTWVAVCMPCKMRVGMVRVPQESGLDGHAASWAD